MMTRIESATATAAFFLPMRRARRQNWAERYVSRLWAAAQAHWLSTSFSHGSPFVVLPERRFPPVTLLLGQHPAHEARCEAVGKTDMSTPISAMTHCDARWPTPVTVSILAAASAKGA